MNAKKLSYVFILISLVVFIGLGVFLVSKQRKLRKPIIFTGEIGLVREMDIDTLISEADIIAVGEFESIPLSQWNTTSGRLPENATYQTVWDEELFIYTEQIFVPRQTLKDDRQNRAILVRSFGGQVEQDIMTPGNSNAVAYKAEKPYLLFLSYYPDSVKDSTPGYFIATNSPQGVYEIKDSKAISGDDEWILEELIAYIQKSGQ